MNTLGAITRATITELESTKIDPFKSIKIQGEGKDAEKAAVVSVDQLHDIARTFLPATASAPALIVLLQMELGTRVGEVSGLGIVAEVKFHSKRHWALKGTSLYTSPLTA